MKKIVEPLLEWYLKNKRDLPWREDTDPYHVWISEIMLQQTRIEAVLGYYKRFMERVPTIEDLSKIDEDELLKLWEGLGYYSRARNLKKAAMMIMEKYHGIFPSTYSDILSLPGIGEYTAGAIGSISFHLKEVAIDGNVLRVYARYNNSDIDVKSDKIKKEVGSKIKDILPDNSGDFNQALMELGEVICLPNTLPKCEICPLKETCKAHKYHKELELPRQSIKMDKKEEYLTVFILIWNKKIAICKRKDGLLKNMWEFPNKEGHLSIKEVKELFPSSSIFEGISNTHVFTHKKWYMKSYVVSLVDKIGDYEWVSLEDIHNQYALPTAFKPFLKNISK